MASVIVTINALLKRRAAILIWPVRLSATAIRVLVALANYTCSIRRQL